MASDVVAPFQRSAESTGHYQMAEGRPARVGPVLLHTLLSTKHAATPPRRHEIALDAAVLCVGVADLELELVGEGGDEHKSGEELLHAFGLVGPRRLRWARGRKTED